MTISGVFEAPGTVMESEIWMDLNDLRTLSQRDNLSCVAMRLDTAAFEAMAARLRSPRLLERLPTS